MVAPATALSEAEGLTVSGPSRCPSPAAVRTLLTELVPAGQEHVLERGVEVTLASSPTGYRVRVTTEERAAEKEWSDPVRDCQRRARVAAVFVFLTILPPELWTEALAPQEPEPPPESVGADEVEATEGSGPGASPRRGVRLELAGSVESAVGSTNTPVVSSPAVELRSVIGWSGLFEGAGGLRAYLAAGFAPEVEFELPGLEGRLWRLPTGAGLHWELPLDRGWVALESGVQAQVHGARSTSALHTGGDVVLRWGARAGLRLGYELGDFVPLLAVHGTFLADRRPLHLEPRGEVGELPRWWVGASLGIGWNP